MNKPEELPVPMDDYVDGIIKELEKKSQELLEKHDIQKELDEVRDIVLPSNPVDLRNALIEQYSKVCDVVMEDWKTPLYHPYWEVWSGKFNRHLRQLDSKYEVEANLIFQTWSTCHKLLNEFKKPRILRKKTKLQKPIETLAKLRKEFEAATTTRKLDEIRR